MDFFPELGEPGIFDDLFYFGPIFFQIACFIFLWRWSARWKLPFGMLNRIAVCISLQILISAVLLIAAIILFGIAIG